MSYPATGNVQFGMGKYVGLRTKNCLIPYKNTAVMIIGFDGSVALRHRPLPVVVSYCKRLLVRSFGAFCMYGHYILNSKSKSKREKLIRNGTNFLIAFALRVKYSADISLDLGSHIYCTRPNSLEKVPEGAAVSCLSNIAKAISQIVKRYYSLLPSVNGRHQYETKF